MNFFTLTLLAAFVSTASGSSLRGDFESDVVDTSNRNLQNCVSSRSSYLGCFANRVNNRALPYQVPGKFHSAEDCESACLDKGYMIFAREWKGQCFCGNGGGYDRHGSTGGCDCCGDNVGGNRMCVWMIGESAPGCDGSGAPSAPYLGCFANRVNNRALPYQVPGKFHSAEDCESACLDKGYMIFAREWKGQCFCGNGGGYDRHGSTGGCDCCGDNVGGNRMCVWMIGESAPGCDGSGAPSAPYLGCYKDRNLDRALPYRVDGRGHSAKDCQDACSSKGMDYFAREWRGQCFCSNDNDYDKHGTSRDCDCCGRNVGGGIMCVWHG
ncbi:hypothetical protein ACHAXR_004522 [Thalassiosira sp. AJA248-18]